MARVAAFIPDLLFGSRVQGDLRAAGHDVELIAAAAALPAALRDADALVVDLTADASERIDGVGVAGVPVLAFYSHVDVEVRDLARGAGFTLVVPRSRMAREGAALLDRVLGDMSGPSVE